MTDILQFFRQRPIFDDENVYSYSVRSQNGETIIENHENVEELNIDDILSKINNKHNQIENNTLFSNKKIVVQLKKKVISSEKVQILFNELKPTDIEITIRVPDKDKITTSQKRIMKRDYDRLTSDFVQQNVRKPQVPNNLIKASSYYLNNRKGFINFMNKSLLPYKNISNQNETLTCKTLKDKRDFSLMPHQNIVREYINTYSPYRGLLLYHGLGSGKTCSSIAIAEGMKSERQIMVLTPASLKTNYVEELKSCGDIIYKKQQHWELKTIDENSELQTKLLELTPVLRKKKRIWVINENKEPNYEKLSVSNQKSLDKQLDAMIQTKYEFIHYNGLNKNKMNALTQKNTVNPFSNKVVIVDEAHNLVSRIVNKLSSKENSISLDLYQYLLSAENTKIVFLSGTPIINYPHETAVMFNILRGYIHTYKIKLKVNRVVGKHDTAYFENLLTDISTTDYVNYVPSTGILTITKNPFGFVNSNVTKKKSEEGEIGVEDYKKLILNKLNEQSNISIQDSNIEIEYNKALPDDKEVFESLFIENKRKVIKFVNTNMFQRRIIGLVSYFRSSQEKLMPKFDRDTDMEIVKIEMSNYQFEKYNLARIEERKTETKYSESSSSYRVFSRAFCNFVFPQFINRPLPGGNNLEEVIKLKVNEEVMEQNMENEDLKEVDVNYELLINEALKKLDEQKSMVLDKKNLQTYSPKFLHLLENITNDEFEGMHLVYSHFRTLEGIGIFRLVLIQNGFAEFKLQKVGNKWTIKNIDEIKGKNTFVLYTGTETMEEKEIIRNVFNSAWDNVPLTIREPLQKIAQNNNYGEVIKVFMISSSGAEGISLRNVNYVHIVEPYWHPVRTDQVIGRARRICSHDELPVEKQFVKVFMYLMTLTKEQIQENQRVLFKSDLSKLSKEPTPYTTDQMLYEVSEIKRNTTDKMLKAIKEASIDCTLYSNDEKLTCYSFSSNPKEFVYTPSFENQEKDNMLEKNINKEKWTGKRVVINGVKYAHKYKNGQPTNELYDYDSYKEAKKSVRNSMVLVGYMKILESGEVTIVDTD